MIAPHDRLASRAALPILALVSGLPSVARQTVGLAMLQAFLDDSGKEEVFVIAGFVGRVETWLSFSDKWQEALISGNPIAYLKTRDAYGKKNEFKRFDDDEVEEKIKSLCAVINSHSLFGVAVTVDTKGYKDTFDKKLSVTFDGPTFHAYVSAINEILVILYENCILETVDIIIDEENGTIYNDILAFWDYLKTDADKYIRRRLGSPPAMKDDLKVLPLQAADMLAWHMLKGMREQREGFPQEESIARKFFSSLEVPIFTFDWDERHSKGLMKLMKQRHRMLPYEDNKGRRKRHRKILNSSSLSS